MSYFHFLLFYFLQVLGEEHPSVAETLNNIGLLLYTQGQMKEALPLYERALEIKRLAYGEMNPSVATSLNNLGSLYHRIGQFDHAASLYKSAYDIRRALLGEVHDDTLIVEENIKSVKRDKQKWTLAQGHYTNSNSAGGIGEDSFAVSSAAASGKGSNSTVQGGKQKQPQHAKK